MTNEKYEFGAPAQLKLLALLVRAPDLAPNLIEPHYFTECIFADIARLVTEAYAGKNLKTDRFDKVSLWALVWSALRKLKGKRAYNLKRPYLKTVRDIFRTHLSDKNLMLDLARRFVKERLYRQALVDAEKDLNAGRHEAMIKRIEELRKIDSQRSPAMHLPVYHLHRFVAKAKLRDERANHIVFPIIPRRGATLLYGLPKELKSWMAAALAVEAASGGTALNFFDVPRPVKTLYVQVEDTEFTTQQRIKALAWTPGHRKSLGMLKIIPRCALNLTDPHWLSEFKREIERFRPKLIVLDVFRQLFRGNVIDAKDTSEFLRILDGLRDMYKCAILLVHHAKKGAEAEIQAKALGSVNLTAWADVLLYTGRKRCVGKASVADLQIESKSSVPDHTKLVVVVESDTFPMVRVLDERKYELECVLACIRENPGLNQKQVEEKTGTPEKRLRALLRRAVDEKHLRMNHGDRKTLHYYPARKD